MLSVKDNGRDFDIERNSEREIDERAVGLLGMRERFT